MSKTSSARTPTLFPDQWHLFERAFKPIIKEEFQDAATYMFDGTAPDYVLKTPQEILTDAGYDLTRELDKFEEAIILAKIKKLTERATEFPLSVQKLFDRTLLHVSQDSMVQVQSFVEDYPKVTKSRNPNLLWQLLHKSHITKNSAVTDEEKRAAAKRLEDLRQVAEDGRTVPLKLYNETWNELHKQAKDIGVTTLGTEDQLVKLYMNSLDKSVIGAEIARKLFKPKHTPRSVASAQTWAITFTNHSEQVLGKPYDQQKRSFSQSGTANAAAPVSLPENAKRPRLDSPAPAPPRQPCKFCLGNGHSVDLCYKLIAYLKENRTEIDTWCATRKGISSAPKGGNPKGGKPKGGNPKGGNPKGGNPKGGNSKGGNRYQKHGKHANTANSSESQDIPDPSFADWYAKSVSQPYVGIHSIGHNPIAFQLANESESYIHQYLVDNGANVSIICNPDYIWDLHDIKSTTISGVGHMHVTQAGTCAFGHAFFNSNMKFNLIAQWQVEDRHQSKKDTSVSDSYILDNHVELRRGAGKLYWLHHSQVAALLSNKCYTALSSYSSQDLERLQCAWPSYMESEPQPQHYNATQKRRAEAVRKIHEILNHPSDAVLGVIFDTGAIHGCPYTSRDVRIIRKIYGECEACIKGKSVKPSTKLVKNRFLPFAPGEQLCIDIFFITFRTRLGKIISCPFLRAVCGYCTHVSSVWLKSKTAHAVKDALFEIIKFYNVHDWVVKQVSCDRESVLTALQPVLLDTDPRISFDQRGTDQKQPEAERSIRTSRDTLRTIKAACWFKPPQFLYPYAIVDIDDTWNQRPNSKTLNLSPTTIVTGTKLYFDQHIQTPMFMVGEFLNPRTKTMFKATPEEREQQKNEERTATGILIGRNYDPTGTLKVYMIDSGTIVNRAKLKAPCRQTAELRRRLESLCENPINEDDLITPIPKLRLTNKRSAEITDHPDQHPATGTLSSDDTRETEDENESLTETAIPDDVPTGTPEEGVSVTPPCNQKRVRSDSPQSPGHPSRIREADGSAPLQDTVPEETSVQPSSVPDPVRKGDLLPRPTRLTRKSRAPVVVTPKRAPERRSTRRRNPNYEHHSVKFAVPRHQQIQAIYMAEKFGVNSSQFQRFCCLADDNLTVRQAVDKYPTLWGPAMQKELTQFHDMKVGRVIQNPVPDLRHKRIIRVNGFYREVFDLQTSELAKLKFRLVPEGHRVDKSVYRAEEKTSPTVSMDSIFASINVATHEKRKGFTMDIPGAYLNAQLPDPHMVRFPKDLADIYISLYPEYETQRQADGSLLFLVEKAFYGLTESSHLWYEEFKSFLTDLGYVNHPADQGLFIKTTPEGYKLTICLWVDDILGFSQTTALINELRNAIVAKYGDARFKDGPVLSFIGLTITQPSRGYSQVQQTEYVKKIVAMSGVTTPASSPTHPYMRTGKPPDSPAYSDPTRFLS